MRQSLVGAIIATSSKRGKGDNESMRFMLTFQIGLEKVNAAVRGVTLGQTIESILDDIKPEAAYF